VAGVMWADWSAMSPALTVPTLDADPWRLRPFGPHDLGLVEQASADHHIPLITSIPSVWTPEAGERYLDRQADRARSGEGWSFVIDDGRPGDDAKDGIGSIGLWRRDIEFGRASIGYWVIEPARRRGAITSSLKALSRWALTEELGIERVEVHIEPWNEPSLRAAAAAGFQREGVLRSWLKVGNGRKNLEVWSLLPSDLAAAG